MSLQLEIDGIAPPSIATPKGRMKLSSLRPGDWIADDPFGCKRQQCVLINSAKQQRMVLRHQNGSENSYPYDAITGYGEHYIGHGKKRRWVAWLPRWIAKHICPFSAPATSRKREQRRTQ